VMGQACAGACWARLMLRLGLELGLGDWLALGLGSALGLGAASRIPVGLAGKLLPDEHCVAQNPKRKLGGLQNGTTSACSVWHLAMQAKTRSNRTTRHSFIPRTKPIQLGLPPRYVNTTFTARHPSDIQRKSDVQKVPKRQPKQSREMLHGINIAAGGGKVMR
jgi:hypothetical protein